MCVRSVYVKKIIPITEKYYNPVFELLTYKLTTLTFRDLKLNDQVLEGLDAMRFEKPTPVQEQAIPVIMEGADLMACAQTGTGKTAAFLLPMLHNLSQNPTDTISTLIMVPTRELAIQIDQQLEGFSYFIGGVSSLAIYGGQSGDSFNQEKKALSTGASIIVATPGRLITHLRMGYVKFSQLKHFILDEADRMLDMGFMDDIVEISSHLPKNRQTLMFSATMPPKIKRLAGQILNRPKFISLAISKPAEGVQQGAYMVEKEQKLSLLKYVLRKKKNPSDRTLIFCSRKMSVKEITGYLKRNGFQADEIHSDLEQETRNIVLQRFKNGDVPVLVATDILSRGIDVKEISLVVNYDMPGDEEDYIHRVGRTARADATGTALTFVTRRDRFKLGKIEQLMEVKVQRLSLPEFLDKKPQERQAETVGSEQQAARKRKRPRNRNRNQNRSRGGGSKE